MNQTMKKVRVLSRAESLLFKIHLRTAVRQTLMYAAGLLAALTAAAMVDASAYLYLAERFDPALAALMVAGCNAALAIGLFMTAARTRPGAEAAMVEEVRDLTVTELQEDAEAVERQISDVMSEIKKIRSGVSRMFTKGGAWDGLLLLGPLLDLGLSWAKRAKKE